MSSVKPVRCPRPNTVQPATLSVSDTRLAIRIRQVNRQQRFTSDECANIFSKSERHGNFAACRSENSFLKRRDRRGKEAHAEFAEESLHSLRSPPRSLRFKKEKHPGPSNLDQGARCQDEPLRQQHPVRFVAHAARVSCRRAARATNSPCWLRSCGRGSSCRCGR